MSDCDRTEISCRTPLSQYATRAESNQGAPVTGYIPPHRPARMESTFVILFSIASLVAIAVRRAKVPYTIALVVVGLFVSALHVMDAPHLTKELLFALFLPGLVFEAAYNIHVTELRATWRTITALAVPGVIAAIAVTAAVIVVAFRLLGLEPGLTWQYAMVFAALVAATDPIAVVSLFRQLGFPLVSRRSSKPKACSTMGRRSSCSRSCSRTSAGRSRASARCHFASSR